MKKFIAPMLATFLAGCLDPTPVPGPATVPVNYAGPFCEPSSPYVNVPPPPSTPISPLIQQSRIAYHAWFPNGSLECGFVDYIHAAPQPMKYGDGRVADTTGIRFGAASSGALMMGLIAPDPIPPNEVPSVAVSSTNLNFGPSSVFTASATFRALGGPRIEENGPITNAWAVTVTAREGDEQNFGSYRRLAVTFRVKDQAAKLSVQETGYDPPRVKNVDQAVVDGIFDKTSPRSFTLELFVNRQTGHGVASLKSGDYRLDMQFEIKALLAASVPTITAVGATLADCCAPGWAVYAEVTDFKIEVPTSTRLLRVEPNVPTGGKPDDTRPH